MKSSFDFANQVLNPGKQPKKFMVHHFRFKTFREPITWANYLATKHQEPSLSIIAFQLQYIGKQLQKMGEH